MEQKNKKFKHLVLLVGNRLSGKISKLLARKLRALKIQGTVCISAKTPEIAFQKLLKFNDSPIYTRVDVIFLYCEDTDKTNRKFLNPSLALNCENFISSLSNKEKFYIHHSYELGNIFGDKLKTNKFFTRVGILCPQIITNPEYDKPIFVNTVNGSRSPEARVIPNGSLMDPTKYNTKFIDTSYEYQGKTYYVNPRIYALGKQITHMMIKCAPAEKKIGRAHV